MEANAIAEPQGAAGPADGRARRFVCQLPGHHGVQVPDCLVEPFFYCRSLMSARSSIVAQAAVWLRDRPPGPRAMPDAADRLRCGLALALDRLGLMGQGVEMEIRGKSAQQFVEPVRRKRCDVLHLPPESGRFAPGQELS